MQRSGFMALCLALVNIVMMGCAAKTSPGQNPAPPLTPAFSAGLLTAVDVDVFDDHTLITIQSNAPLRYSVRRDHIPPRLIVDLPDHVVAPGVRSLQVQRGGVTVIQPAQAPNGHGSQVEIGLQRLMSHTLSLPLDRTLLVELRPEPTIATSPGDAENTPARRPGPSLPAAPRLLRAADDQEALTLGRAEPGTAERATEMIGVAVEPLPDRTSVRVFGNGPILLYKSRRQENPPQLLLSFPNLETTLSGRGIFVPTHHLQQLTVLRPTKEGPLIKMILFPEVFPQIVREGSQVIVELSRPTSRNGGQGTERKTPAVPIAAPGSAVPSLSERPAGPRETGTSGGTPEPPPSYVGQRISLDFQQADIIDVLRLLAEVSGLNIITSEDVKGLVTTRMVNVPWDQALDVILKTHSLGKEQEGTIIRVAPLERLRKERDEELQAKRTVEELEPPITRTIQLNYARADDLKTNMEKLLTKQGRLDIDKRTNTIIVKDVGATVEEILDLVRRLDSQTKQVSIEVRIVETNRTFLQELGVRWGGLLDKETGVKFPRRVQLSGRAGAPGINQEIPVPLLGNVVVDLPTARSPAAAFGFSLISNSSILDLELQALEASGRGRIISSPKVVTLDNKEAIIESGEEVPFETTSTEGTKIEFKDAKITLKVTPHVSPDDFVLLEIDAAKKEVNEARTVKGQPGITSRQSKTSVLVKDGTTAVIGGLFKGTTADTRRGVPGLSKVPYLGWLFKTEQTRDDTEDLLFFITPRIVKERRGALIR